jgi:hypothetical protein
MTGTVCSNIQKEIPQLLTRLGIAFVCIKATNCNKSITAFDGEAKPCVFLKKGHGWPWNIASPRSEMVHVTVGIGMRCRDRLG